MLMNNLQTWVSQLDFSQLRQILVYTASVLTCIILHELAHGFTALLLGDHTAQHAGRLTLNPIRHIDPVGLLLLATVHFGWAKPVPVNMRNFKKPKTGMALTAIAGPAANILIAFFALLILFSIYKVNSSGPLIILAGQYLEYCAVLSCGLAVFNCLPIPPLDGSKVLFSLLPEQLYRVLMRYERWGFLVLLALSYTGITHRFISGAIDGLLGILIQFVMMILK